MTLADIQKIVAVLQKVGVQITMGQALMAVTELQGQGVDKPTTESPIPHGASLPDVLNFGADADLAPYGVALIGFSPQNHQGANLRVAENAKYIAYAYLVANKIQPDHSTWAKAAVDFLKAIVPDVPWTVLDDETLGYGDEYIHTAPRGWGDPGLLHRDDLNPLEFYWGAFTA